MVQDILLARVVDDDAKVANAVLGAPGLIASVSPMALAKALLVRASTPSALVPQATRRRLSRTGSRLCSYERLASLH